MGYVGGLGFRFVRASRRAVRSIGGIYLLVRVLLLGGGLALAQEFPPDTVGFDAGSWEQRMELGDDAGSEFATLSELYSKRLDVNTANRAQLLDIPGLTPQMVDAILDYRRLYGRMLTPFELAWVPGISPSHARFLLAFLKVPRTRYSEKEDLFAEQEVQAIQRFSYPIPFERVPVRNFRSDETRPQGSPLAMMTRLTYTAGSWLRVGFRGMKQAEEPFAHSFNKLGYGMYTGYVELSLNTRFAQRIVVGDFTLTTGYGLGYSSSALRFPVYSTFALSKRPVIPRGVLAYSGSDLPTGVAVYGRIAGNLYATVAYGMQKINASLVEEEGHRLIVTRNPSSAVTSYSRWRSRHTTWQQTLVGDISYSGHVFSIGTSTSLIGHQFPFRDVYPKTGGGMIPPRTLVRSNVYGRVNVARTEIWGDVSYQWPESHLWAELPRWSSPLALHLGVSGDLSGALSFGGYLYAYGARNTPLLQYSYAMSGRPVDCTGLALLLEFRPSFERGLYLRHQVENTGMGLSTFAYAPERRHLQIGFDDQADPRYTARVSYSYRNYSSEGMTSQRIRDKHHLRAGMVLHFGNVSWGTTLLGNAILRDRAQYFGYGYGVVQDVDFRLPRLRLRARVGYHNTMDSRSPLYIYEPGLPYSFSQGTLSRNAIRGILLAEWSPTRSWNVALRLSQTFFLSGSLETYGSRLTPHEMMLRRSLRAELQVEYHPSIFRR